MNGIEIYDFIKPHLGNINAIGNHSVDMKNLNNFEKYQELINCLLEDLDRSFYHSKNSYKDSVKVINNRAKEVMIEVYEWLDNYQNEFQTGE